MRRFGMLVLCAASVLAGAAVGQGSTIEPIHAQPGSVLTFHLQTRLNPPDPNEIDVLPRGTVIRVKLLSGVDSAVDRDGSVFRGEVIDSVSAGDKVIVHSEAEVRGILVLLRSKNHPQGFRYELLLTSVTDHAKTYDMTASLNPSFFDDSGTSAPVSKADVQHEPDTRDAKPANLPSSLHN